MVLKGIFLYCNICTAVINKLPVSRLLQVKCNKQYKSTNVFMDGKVHLVCSDRI